MHCSSLLFLVGGGRDPRYPPNKVIFWNEALGKEIAELEFREKVRGLACRRGWLVVALRRRVVAFEIGESVKRYGEWDTYDNSRGEPRCHLLAPRICLNTDGFARVRRHRHCHRSILDRTGCTWATTRARAINSPSTLSPTHPHWSATSQPPAPTATTNDEAPAFRHSGAQYRHYGTCSDTVREISRDDVSPRDAGPRMGYDYGEADTRVATRHGSGGDLRGRFSSGRGGNMRLERQGHHSRLFIGRSGCRALVSVTQAVSWRAWVHSRPNALGLLLLSRNRQSKLSSLTSFIPIPKYFESEWSYAQFRIPTQSAHISLTQQAAARDANPDLAEEEKCTVGWIEAPQTTTPHSATAAPPSAPEYQLIALTYTGGWYRLALPNKKPSSTASGAAHTNVSSSGSVRSGRPRSPSGSTVAGGGRGDKGKGVSSRDSDRKDGGRDCTLMEFRRFGSWDGWG